MPPADARVTEPMDRQDWAMAGAKLQKMSRGFGAGQVGQGESILARAGGAEGWQAKWNKWLSEIAGTLPLASPDTRARLWEDSVTLWSAILEQYGSGLQARKGEAPDLPRKDRRFADPRWREQPVFALIHQTYLLLAERINALANDLSGVSPERHEQIRFLTRVVTDALSPANFPLTNPM
ncbi:class I poly(R)-hydroxyalkanoic acid synthase, partial [Sphingomonas koreensis]